MDAGEADAKNTFDLLLAAHLVEELGGYQAVVALYQKDAKRMQAMLVKDGSLEQEEPDDLFASTQGNAKKGDDVRPAEALLPGTVEVDCKRMTVQELFEHFGQAGEHGLGEPQILAALSANGVQESEAFMHDILNTFDLDGNGRLDLEEFTQMHAIVSMRARLSKARKAAPLAARRSDTLMRMLD